MFRPEKPAARVPSGVQHIVTSYQGLFDGYASSRPGGRDVNQDTCAYTDTPLGLLVLVCDGMGKGEYGHVASLLAAQAIAGYLQKADAGTDPADAVRAALVAGNEAVLDFAGEHDAERDVAGMGTTVAGLLLTARAGIAFHIGDSRVYLLHNGYVKYRSGDHSKTMAMVRARVMSEEAARLHPDRNLVTSALGHGTDQETEIATVPYRRGDRFVLCTDGVWRAFKAGRFARAVSRNPFPAMAVAGVMDAAEETTPDHDNMSLAIIDTKVKSKLNTPMPRYLRVLAAVILVALAASVAINILLGIDNRRQQEIIAREPYYDSIINVKRDSIDFFRDSVSLYRHREAVRLAAERAKAKRDSAIAAWKAYEAKQKYLRAQARQARETAVVESETAEVISAETISPDNE